MNIAPGTWTRNIENWHAAGEPRHGYESHPSTGTDICWRCARSASAAAHLAPDATLADVRDAIRRLDDRGDYRPGPRAEMAELRQLEASMVGAGGDDTITRSQLIAALHDQDITSTTPRAAGYTDAELADLLMRTGRDVHRGGPAPAGPVAGALQEVNRVQGAAWPGFEAKAAAELPALRELAEAVRAELAPGASGR